MPMAGLGTRLANYDSYPKPLISVLGKTVAEWSIKTLGLDGNYIFCCKKEHLEKFDMENILTNIVPDCKIIAIDYQTKGTVQSVLEASHLINNNEELIISDADHYLIWDVDFFNKKIRTKEIDACVMVFAEEYFSKKASYLKLNDEGYIIEAAEKNPISKTASVGVHYYKKGSDFVRLGNKMIGKNLTYNNEFYITPIYNLFVEEKKKVIVNPVKKMWALGSPEEIELFVSEFNKLKKL